jgi:hypothetical protein
MLQHPKEKKITPQRIATPLQLPIKSPTTSTELLRYGSHCLLNKSAIPIVKQIPHSVIEQTCHFDRSAAEWRNLLFLRFAAKTMPKFVSASFPLTTPRYFTNRFNTCDPLTAYPASADPTSTTLSLVSCIFCASFNGSSTFAIESGTPGSASPSSTACVV